MESAGAPLVWQTAAPTAETGIAHHQKRVTESLGSRGSPPTRKKKRERWRLSHGRDIAAQEDGAGQSPPRCPGRSLPVESTL